MNTPQQAIKTSLSIAREVTDAILHDLSDDDLMVRPVPGANHIAWQLGHLISSEHHMMSAMDGADMPALPDGFAERHGVDASKSDDRSKFDTKEKYVKLYQAVRAATLAALDRITVEQLDQPAPESIREHSPTVGHTLALQAAHELMHVGRYSVVRRKLGKPPAF